MATLFPLSEPVVMAVVDRLELELEAVVDEINATATDGIVIPQVEEVLDYIPSVRELTRFPTVAVQEIATDFEDDVGWGATGVHRLVVVCFYQHADQRTLARSLRRYAKAIANVVLRTRQIGPAWGVVLDGTVPGPTLGSREEPRSWMSYVGVAVTLKDEQDTP